MSKTYSEMMSEVCDSLIGIGKKDMSKSQEKAPKKSTITHAERDRIRLEICIAGTRWANNIVTELLSNNVELLSDDAREGLRAATHGIGEAINAIHTTLREKYGS